MTNTLDTATLQAALDTATVRTFQVPGVGRVRVEIGDEISRAVDIGRYEHGHSYPAHRVSVDGRVVMEGADWGVPVHECTDDMDAMLSLLTWLDHVWEADLAEPISQWARDRRDLRDALSAPWREGDPRETVRAAYRGELG